MKTGLVTLGALAAVIAGGSMTGEPGGIQGHEFAFEGEINVPCLGAYVHDSESLNRSMLLLQYDYRLAFHPEGDLVVDGRTPQIADWTNCVGTSR